MRKLILSFVLATAGAVGLTATAPAQAYDDGRIFVSIGDVTFSSGQPYHRYSHQPLYVVRESYGPRYYYTGPRYVEPVRYYAPPRAYYPPPRAYYPSRDYRAGYREYGYTDYRYDNRHDRRDHRRDDRHWDDRRDHRGHR